MLIARRNGDALHAALSVVGYNIQWLLQAIGHLGLTSLFVALVTGLAMSKRVLVGHGADQYLCATYTLPFEIFLFVAG